jgi:hypothetical protein
MTKQTHYGQLFTACLQEIQARSEQLAGLLFHFDQAHPQSGIGVRAVPLLLLRNSR